MSDIYKDMCCPDEDCPVHDFARTHDLPEAYTRGFGILKDEIAIGAYIVPATPLTAIGAEFDFRCISNRHGKGKSA